MEGGGFAATFYCLLGHFVEIFLASKMLRKDRTAAEQKMLLMQPAAGEECRKRHSLFKKIMQGTGTRIAGERGIYDRDYEK